jgi:hypothetical protein
MTKTAAADPATAAPTALSPQAGAIGVVVGDHSVQISTVSYWIEDDGTHVFRSEEFDCMAEAQGSWEAARKFVDNAEDLFRFLDDVVDAGRATEAEKLTLIKLSRRFFELYEACQLEAEAEQNHRIRNLLRLLRQSRRSQPQWQPQPKAPADYSQLSHA